jgi:hypothetical protein
MLDQVVVDADIESVSCNGGDDDIDIQLFIIILEKNLKLFVVIVEKNF